MKELLTLLDNHENLIVRFRKEFSGKYIAITFSEDSDQDGYRNLSQLITREEFEAFFDVILHKMEDQFYEETE